MRVGGLGGGGGRGKVWLGGDTQIKNTNRVITVPLFLLVHVILDLDQILAGGILEQITRYLYFF
jgi:hypothetical protein